MSSSVSRVVVAATTSDPQQRAVRVSRDLLASGHEVVYLGDGLTPLQVARSAVAEDAARVVVSDDAVDAVRDELETLGIDDIEVTPLGS